MEFIISRNILLSALQRVRRAINVKNPDTLLRCFLFTFPDDPKEASMTITATNGDLLMTATVALDAPAVDPRPIAVYYSDLLRPVKSLDQQPLRIVAGEYQMTVYHAIGSFRLQLDNRASSFPRDFPTPDVEAPDCHLLEYEAPGLRSILSRCAYAMACDELRPALNGVYVNLTSDYSDYVASDGHKLVRVRKRPVYGCTTATTPVVTSFILPAPIVRTLLQVLPFTGDVTVEYQKEQIVAKKQDVSVRKARCRIVIDDFLTLAFLPVDGLYPRYWSVIPDKFNIQMTIDRLPLVKSIDRLSLFAPASQMVMLTVNESQLGLKAEDCDFNVASEETLPCVCSMLDGSTIFRKLRIGVKSSVLAATLKVLNVSQVSLLFIDEVRALVVRPKPQPDTEELTLLLMPMLINDEAT